LGALVVLCVWTAVVPGSVEASVLPATPDDPVRPEESHDTGWSLYVDNDAFTLVNRDQKYTGGAALTLSGHRAVEYPWSLDPALASLNRLTGWSGLYGRQPARVSHSWEIGATAFTPEDIEVREPIPDDVPYASLIFVSNTRQVVVPRDRVSYQSSFAVGVLGADIVPALQRVMHRWMGDTVPRGWDNQISDGGEPTALYRVARQQTHFVSDVPGSLDYELKSTVGGSAGYTTQVMTGLNWRWGPPGTSSIPITAST